MGQKINPNSIRLGIVREPDARWYAQGKRYAAYLHSDIKVREFLEQRLHAAGVNRIYIERQSKSLSVTVYAARPGVIIGKKGSDVETLRREIMQRVQCPVNLNIKEVSKPDLEAKLVAMNIAQQLERRVMFRRAMKRAVQNAMRAGLEGVKVELSGRLNGNEIARSEWYREGRVPLHTFRANIEYALAEAKTTYGIIGVKVWLFKGEKFQQRQARRGSGRPADKERTTKK